MKSKALREVQTDPIAPAVRKRILADLNTRYSAVLLAFAWRICDKPNAVTAKAAEIDNSGLVLTVEDSKGKQGIARVMFDEPLTAANAEQQFTVLHQRALAPFLPSGPSPILALLGLLSLVLVAFPELSPPLEPFQKVNGLILEYVLSAGIPFVTSLSDLQRIFFIAVGAHVIETGIAAYLLATRLYVVDASALKWCALVFIFGFPVLGLITKLSTSNSLRKLKSQ